MIKVMVVDDSALIRKLLTDILISDKELMVVGTARNGKDALEKIKKFKPDVITLDVEMPVMDGLTTLKHIVSKYKIPVIMISTLTQNGADLTLKALEEGAVDFLPKPTNVFGLNQNEVKNEIINKIKAAAKTKVEIVDVYKPIEKKKVYNKKKSKGKFSSILAIGTSTGGPRALQNLIPQLPADINATIVIVQHMPPKFTKSLSDRLNATSNINIKEAEEGDILERGWGYIAPGDYHMTIVKEANDLVVRLNQKPQVMGLRPTVDVLMESISKIKEYSKIGIILTGMGSDGAKGIKQMKDSNSSTIAQDESTSVVFGMPKAAIASGCIDLILPIDKIADSIISKVGV